MKHPDDDKTRDLKLPARVPLSNYQGGKNGAGVYQTIINCIPWHWRYVEPFAGSAAIYRNKLPARLSILIEADANQVQRLKSELPATIDRNSVVIKHDEALDWLRRCIDMKTFDAQTFIYLDPPYHPDARRSTLQLYEHDLTRAQHHHLVASLLPTLAAAGVKFALSGYRCAVYDDAAGAQGWHRKDFQAMTHTGMQTESLWMNYDPAAIELHDYRYLGDDFRQRERIARKVKRWAGKLRSLPRHERGAILAALAGIGTASNGERIPDA